MKRKAAASSSPVRQLGRRRVGRASRFPSTVSGFTFDCNGLGFSDPR